MSLSARPLRARAARSPSARVLAVVALAVAAPLLAIAPERSISQLTHQVWQDELPQNTVHTVLQTRDGYIWIGTYEGLARFDGVRFEVFDRHRSGHLAGTTALDLAEGGDGRLFVATNGGLSVLTAGQFRTLGVGDGLPSARVNASRPMPDGTVWLGTDAGLAELHGLTVRPRPDLATAKVWALATGPPPVPGRRPSLWVGASDGLLRIDGEVVRRYTTADGLPADGCRVLLVDPDGTVWTGGDAGLARLGPDGAVAVWRAADGLGDDYVRALARDRHGSLWIGTESAGLVRMRDGRFERFGAREGLSHAYVRSIFEDREGNLWVGTNGGLNRFRQGKFVNHGVPEGLSRDFVRAVFEDRDGNLWVGTDGGGVNRRAAGAPATGGWTRITTAEGLSYDAVRAIAQTPDGALWFGTRFGLDRLHAGRITRFATRDGLPSLLVRALFVDRAGDLWLGAESGGLVRLRDAGREVTVWTTADGLAGDDVRAIHEDRRGRLWIGTTSGLSRLADGRLTTWRTRDGLSNDMVFAFHEDADGELWIGTDSGLNLLREDRPPGETFARFDAAGGLYDSKVFRILEDDRGVFWMSSNRGVFTARRADLLAFAAGRLARIPSTGYGKSDGMRANQCNGTSQPAGWRTRDGHLWFPTVKGLVEIDPENIPRNPLAPPVIIEAVRLNGAPLATSGRQLLPSDAEQLEIAYTALSFAAPEKVAFRYRLVGSDTGWVEAGPRRTAYYTHLPPGRFRFEVIAANDDGVWNEQGAAVELVVATPATRSWWAYLLYAAAIAGGGIGIASLRMRQLARANAALERRVAERTAALGEKVEQLEISEQRAHESEERALAASRAKSVFLSNMSHELRTPLNSIIGFSEILASRLSAELPEKYVRFIANIHRSGEHLLTLINDLLDLSKIEAGRMELHPEPVDPATALAEARDLVRGMSGRKGIEIEIDTAPTLPRLVTDRAKLRQVVLNLLSNAVKFSPAGSVVTLRARPLAAEASPLATATLAIEVVDRGVGIAAEDQERIFEEFRRGDGESARAAEGTGLGLALVKRLVEVQGGRVRVASAPDAGSTFTVYLPLAPPVDALLGEPPAVQTGAAARPFGRTVLVVEDDPASYHQLASALEGDGYRTLNARDANQALAMVARERPDLVTLDILLPAGDGWQVLRALKADTASRDIPVVILTRLANRELGLAVGAADYFVKPIDGEAFRRRVQQLVEGRAAAGATAYPPPRTESGVFLLDPAATSGAAGRSRTILVVDDDPAIHRTMAAELLPLGYALSSAYDGASGLEAARREGPAAIVLDLVMPGMDGFRVARELAADPTTAAIPVVVLTGKELRGTDVEALAGRVADLVPKGADSSASVRRAIATLLARRDEAARAAPEPR